jgi:hypothetical protein
MAMRGLTQFIGDIRNCTNKEEEVWLRPRFMLVQSGCLWFKFRDCINDGVYLSKPSTAVISHTGVVFGSANVSIKKWRISGP